MTYTLAAFGALDWLVILGYIGVMVVIGLFASKGQKDEETYFLGGRSIPTWAASLSVLATALSAATFIGAPQISFKGDLTYLILNLGGILGAVLVAYFMIPRFYKSGHVTIYGFLGSRMGGGAKVASSATFLFGRLLSSGSRFYMVGIPFALLLFGDEMTKSDTALWITLIILGIVGTVYVACGGIKAVIWTDVIQFFVMTGAVLVAIGIILYKIPDGVNVIEALQNAPVMDAAGNATGETINKLNVWDWGYTSEDGWQFFKAFTFFGAMASVLGTMASYGVDQDMVQRTLTVKSPLRSSMSVISAVLLGIPVVLLFLIVGLLLSIYYARPDIMEPAAMVGGSEKVFPMFLKNEMPTIIAGLAVAGLLAAAMSTFDSAVNSMSSSVITDLIDPVCQWQGKELTAAQKLTYSRVMVVVIGFLLTAFGIYSIYLARQFEDLLSFALGVMAYPYAGLMGVFLVALCTKTRGNSFTAITALVVGAVLVFCMNYYSTEMLWYLKGKPDFSVPGLSASEAWDAWAVKNNIAWVYWLFIGTPITFVICALGKSPEHLVRNQAEIKAAEKEEKAAKKAAKAEKAYA